MDKKTILIISGPSGAGKSSLANNLLKSGKYILVKSNTTRKQRSPPEGNQYNFISKQQFIENISKASYYLEYDEYLTEYYGTLAHSIYEAYSTEETIPFPLASGADCGNVALEAPNRRTERSY